MRRYVKPVWRDRLVFLSGVAVYVVALTVAFFVHWALGLVVTLAGMFVIVAWHRHMTAYRCQHCGEVFTISFLTNLISPHGMGREDNGEWRGWKYLRCPHCGRRSRATVLVAERE